MNEELKIKIGADATELEKALNKVKSSITSTAEKVKQSLADVTKAAAKIGTVVSVAMTAAVKGTEDFRQEMAKLNSAFASTGKSVNNAAAVYKNLYKVIGESDTAVEAAQQIALFARSEEEAIRMSKQAAGVMGTFGDALKPETFFEAANETLKLNEATGAYVQMLEGTGQSVEAFNTQLQSLNSEEERRNFILSTNERIMGAAGEAYNEATKAIQEQRAAQYELTNALAKIGNILSPVVTAFTGMGATLLNALVPALQAVMPYINAFISGIGTAVNWVASFISTLTGTKKAAQSMAVVASSIGAGASGAKGLQNNLEKGVKSAEKLKRSTASFDELNIMSSGSSGAGASGGSSGAGASGASGGVSGGVVGGSLTSALEETANKSNIFAEKLKETFASINFDNLITAFNNVKTSAEPIVTTIKDGLVWFYDNILVPFAAWTIEDILPGFLNILSGALDILNAAIQDVKPLLQWLWDKCLKPIAEWVGSAIASDLETIGDALKWIADNEVAMAILEGIAIAIGLVAGAIAIYNIAMATCNIVTGIFSGIMAVLTSPITLVIAAIAALVAVIILCVNNWDKIKETAVNVWEKIKKTFANIGSWFGEKFTAAYEAVKKAFSKIGSFFSGIWKDIKSTFTDIGQKIGDAVSGAFKKAVNSVLSTATSIINGFISAINLAIGVINKIPGVEIKKLTKLEVPKFARGGIVDTATLGVIGEAGKEAVVPLENNTEWIDILADRLNKGKPSRIVLMLDGKELGWAAIDNINDITEQTGSLQLVMA